MVRPNEETHRQCTATVTAAASGFNAALRGLPDPRAFGLTKAAYSVHEMLDALSIGRTSLYAAVKRGELKPTKFRRKTLFLAANLAEFLARLSQHDDAR